MPVMEFPFSQTINSSVQVGDTLYYVSTQVVGIFDVANPITTMIGEIIAIEESTDEQTGITTTTISANINDETTPPVDGDFLFFSKDKRANISGMLGYYAEVEYRNYSRLPAEMFATATEFVESSK